MMPRPRSRRSILLLPAVLALVVACSSVDRRDEAPATPEWTFAFWNVENLFDADDDPANAGDDEYLPANGWTPERYATKLRHLADVIATVAPHVLGVAEVESRRVLEDLVAEPRLAPLGYRIAHVDSPDGRGIDVALLYREPFALDGPGAVRLHAIDKADARPTRGVLAVELAARGARLAVLVNHWPSRGGDRDGAYREAAGAKTREVALALTEAARAAGREADVLIVGDFNDEPHDASVVQALGAVRSRNAAANRESVRHFFNPSWSLLAEPDVGTIYYNPEWTWNVFDQAIVSRGMLDRTGFRYVDGSLRVHAPPELRDDLRRPLWFRRGRGGVWTEGYSDHFLIHGRIAVGDP